MCYISEVYPWVLYSIPVHSPPCTPRVHQPPSTLHGQSTTNHRSAVAETKDALGSNLPTCPGWRDFGRPVPLSLLHSDGQRDSASEMS